MQLKDCPECGMRNRFTKKTCWKCGHTFKEWVPLGIDGQTSKPPFLSRWRSALRK